MTRIACALVACFALVAAASAQTNVRVRGTITAVDATSMSVKSRDGRDLKLALPENATVAALYCEIAPQTTTRACMATLASAASRTVPPTLSK